MGEPLTASTYFAHPYEAELGTLSYMEWQMVDASRLCPDKPVDPSLEAFAFVDSEPALDEMLSELMKDNVHEIAVDLEHHSMRYECSVSGHEVENHQDILCIHLIGVFKA